MFRVTQNLIRELEAISVVGHTSELYFDPIFSNTSEEKAYLQPTIHKNKERHTADTIVSFDETISFDDDNKAKYIYIFSQSSQEKLLKTNSPTYFVMDNGDNMLNLTRTLDKIYLIGIL